MPLVTGTGNWMTVVPLSRKVTVPVGVPWIGGSGVTVAVKTTLSPSSGLAGTAVIATWVGPRLRLLLLAAKLLSPE